MFRYLVTFLLFFTLGCSSKQPNIDYDPKFETALLKSFTLVKTSSKDGIPLNEERIRDAIKHEMTLKGYKYTDKDTADFRISFGSLIKEDVPSNVSFGFGFGSYSSGVGTSIATSHRPTKDQGELHINMIDPKTKKTFWRSAYSKDIRKFNSPKQRTNYFNKVVAEMLKTFPSHNKVNTIK